MTGPVRSVSLALAILRLVAARPRGMTLSDIARATDLSPSSCLNLLRTLVSEGALERGEDDRRYRLVSGWSATAAPHGRIEQLIEHARTPMRLFAEAHDCTVGLWQVISADRFTLVALGESEAATRIHMVEGQRQPIGGGSIGRALAVAEGLGEAELRRRYAQVRWQQPLPFETYAAQVARAARLGFAIDDGFGHAGICSIGAALPALKAARFCVTASIFARSRDTVTIDAIGQALVGLVRNAALGD